MSPGDCACVRTAWPALGNKSGQSAEIDNFTDGTWLAI
jgi:hypothetical protein